MLVDGFRRQQPDEKTPGLNRIAKWSLMAKGPIAGRLRLSTLQFLRDCDAKSSPDGLVVAGLVKGSQAAIERVRMRYRGFEYETLPTADGVYIFDRKVALDSIIEIYGLAKDNSEIDPVNGRFFHIVTDKSDIDFKPAA